MRVARTYVGTPCKRGHDGTRLVSGGHCLECKRASNAASTARAKTVVRECVVCGTEFNVSVYNVNAGARRGRNVGVYCSLKCRSDQGRITKKCAECQAPFRVMKCEEHRKYCSLKCAGVAPAQVTNTCAVCDKAYSVNAARAGNTKCCSFACLIQYVAALNTKAGLDARNRCGRKAWRGARLVALARDGYACRLCATSESLTVHHIVPWRKSRDDSPENLITLCRACHFRVEYHNPELIQPMVSGGLA